MGSDNIFEISAIHNALLALSAFWNFWSLSKTQNFKLPPNESCQPLF